MKLLLNGRDFMKKLNFIELSTIVQLITIRKTQIVSISNQKHLIDLAKYILSKFWIIILYSALE